MALLTGAAGAAAVIAGIFAGILADRLDRWILMAACDLARMLLYGLIPLVWSVHPEVWLLYVILPLCAALGMIFQVGVRHGGPGPVRPGPDHRSQRAALRSLIDGRDRRAAAGRPALRGPRPGRRDRRGRGRVSRFRPPVFCSFAGVFRCPGRRAAHPAVSGGRIADGCSAMPSATGTPDTAVRGPDRDVTGTPDTAAEPGWDATGTLGKSAESGREGPWRGVSGRGPVPLGGTQSSER